LIAKQGGVLEAEHTEAAIDFARLAGSNRQELLWRL
jgi:3,4-dihydroxy-2-butanone 4-phosphate synthase